MTELQISHILSSTIVNICDIYTIFYTLLLNKQYDFNSY